MRRVASACFIAAALALHAPGQENGAPLSESKQQLQSLRKDQAAEKSGANTAGPAAALRGALPALETSAPVQLPPELTRRDDDSRDAKQKANARKNWLLDGFDKLDRKNSGAGNSARGKERDATEETPLDPADPDYFLRVYEKQRAETMARREQESAAANTRMTGATDAFAPFLQDWLAGSPVRDALRDAAGEGTGNRADGSDSSRWAIGSSSRPDDRAGGGSAGVNAGVSFHDPARRTGAASNPFVQALGLPATIETRGTEVLPPTANPLAAPAASLPSLSPLPEKPADEARRVIVPPPQDAKKYFPQLKKF